MNPMYNDLKELFDEINFLQERQKKLQRMLNCKRFTNIQIHFFADKDYHTIYQQDSPFNMESELRILLEGMIDQIDFDIQNLKLQF